MTRSNYVVLALVALNYLCEAALLTHVDGFALPPVAIFTIAVLMAPIAPLLAILPQLGVRVPTLISPTSELSLAPAAAALEAPIAPAPLHPAP